MALRELVLGVLANIVAAALAFMAGFTEVRVAPTEPLRNTATELALKLNEILSVPGTVQMVHDFSISLKNKNNYKYFLENNFL